MISKIVAKDMENASATRKMFEEGLKLRQKYGDDNVVDFSLGNPMLEPPEDFNYFLKELAESKKTGTHRYMPNAGNKDIRDAVAYHLNKKKYFDGVAGEEVCMTVGAAGALNILFKTILNKGEEVITILPYFPEYRFYIKNHNGKQVFVDSAEDFSLDIKAIEKKITNKTRAILLNSPNNPSGVMYSKQNLEELALMLSDKEKKLGRDIYLISDEPYREMVYSGEFTSPATLHDNSFIAYSWSKSLSLPGERIGYAAVNPKMKHKDDIIKGLAFCNRILGFVNAPTTMQYVLPKILNTAMEEKYFKYMRDYYKSLHDPLEKTLKESGYIFPSPQGSFFFWAKCPTEGKDLAKEEKEFIDDVKTNFLMLLVPGTTFGKTGWFRLSYAVNPKIIDLGCKKLEEVANKYIKQTKTCEEKCESCCKKHEEKQEPHEEYHKDYDNISPDHYTDEGMPPGQKSHGH
jgi:aspartate aminotransferase